MEVERALGIGTSLCRVRKALQLGTVCKRAVRMAAALSVTAVLPIGWF
jgi:hypothetical protein